ncbi:uncharacterized protein LOC132739756 [Ruditapes philippinarum]|uniref:uncharacterized protein LOC132739756 n=1 Tax=Ruditapes philippinarum TaxID=129788 RepID=UPI00295A8E06|nr:uncharacterized protein LOC132739756 [Ruditapes philippinarum]
MALQSMLNDLQVYCQTWGLKVNTNKTKIMIFEKGRHTSYNFVYNDIVLENVNFFKYLGINLFKNGHWNRTQKKLAQHASFSLHNLFTVFNQLELSIGDKFKLFDSMVGSVLNYGAEVYGYQEGKNIETIHCKFLRKVLCVKKATNLDGLYGETGRHPMRIHRKFIMLKYWTKLISLQNDCLLKRMYNVLKFDAENGLSYGGNNWACQIKQILNDIGMSNIWINQEHITINFQQVKNRILDIYKQEWYSNIRNSSRLSSYSIYKRSLETEDYLNKVNINKFRISLTKFRLSSHNLAIETGRYENVARENRLCTNCNLNVIENEFHFLLVCPKYYSLRRKYLKPYYCRWPSIHKFEKLMSTTNTQMLNNLSKFLYFSFKERTDNS